jgi:hypothetical protein
MNINNLLSFGFCQQMLQHEDETGGGGSVKEIEADEGVSTKQLKALIYVGWASYRCTIFVELGTTKSWFDTYNFSLLFTFLLHHCNLNTDIGV